MDANMLHATAIGFGILAQLLLLTCLPASGLRCMRTVNSAQPHIYDCGSKALACRILVNPYRVYNDSAVGVCRRQLKPGDFIYDCAVDCPAAGNNLDWNELVCCKSDNCNSNLEKVITKNYCYISSSDARQRDALVICSDNQKCAHNVKTRDTRCVGESECSKDEWLCCQSKANCGNTWGIPKVENLKDSESTDASNLTASLLMSVASVIVFYAPVL